MSHTFVATDGTRFQYNSDFSGRVFIAAMNVSVEALEEFVDLIRERRAGEPISDVAGCDSPEGAPKEVGAGGSISSSTNVVGEERSLNGTN